jgi:AAA domain
MADDNLTPAEIIENLRRAKRAREEADRPVKFMSRAEFVAGFVVPDYLVDGILQRRFIYALTGQTGHAKTAIAMLLAELASRPQPVALGQHPVAKGHVIYFAGENPDDLRMRIIGANSLRTEDWQDDQIAFVPGIFDIPKIRAEIERYCCEVGGVALVIIDTSAAYFLGADEINNVEMGRHARMLRVLTELPGGPCVLVLCHPIKYVTEASQLLPRGGGAFLAEMDGNLTVMKHDDNLVELHHNKIRGPGFEPISFKLEPIRTDTLTDAKGRQIPTVRAVAISQAEEDQQTDRQHGDEDRVLAERLKFPDDEHVSLSQIAENCSWVGMDGTPLKKRAQRVFERLENANPSLAKRDRGAWRLTEKGKEAARKAALRLKAEQEAKGNGHSKNLDFEGF